MRKVLGLTLALTLALALTAAAEETQGTVKSIDRTSQSFTLEDGTQLSMAEGTLPELTPGEKVRAAYEVRGERKVLVGIDRVTTGPDGQPTSNFSASNAMSGDRLNDIEPQGD